MCHSLLDQSAVNYAIDEWSIVYRPLTTLKADITLFYDCYSQNNNVEWHHSRM